jgi:hypothetical protein
VDRNTAGSVSYTVFQIFIALQAAAPFAGLLLSHPRQVERTDGVPVSCSIPKSQRIVTELRATGKVFVSKPFLMIIPLIAQGVFAEAVFFTYAGLWFSVRARALGSFLSGQQEAVPQVQESMEFRRHHGSARRLVDLGNYCRDRVQADETYFRLGGCRVWQGFCLVCFPGPWVPVELYVCVSLTERSRNKRARH